MKLERSRLPAVFWLAILGVVALLAPVLWPAGPYQTSGSALQPPSTRFLLGTDHLGRDLLGRMIYGSRISVSAALAATVLTTLLGSLAGFSAAVFGRLADRLVIWTANVLLSIPGLLLAMLLLSAIGPSLTAVILAVGIGGAPGFARLTRSLTRGMLHEGYIAAAEALGAGRVWIAVHHLLRNALPQLLSLATTHFAWAFLGTTTLTFLGLTGDPALPEWGAMLNSSRAHLLEAPWAALWPALAISFTILAMHALGGAQSRRDLGREA